MCTQWNCLLISTHNVCFHGEIRKYQYILDGKKPFIYNYDDYPYPHLPLMSFHCLKIGFCWEPVNLRTNQPMRLVSLLQLWILYHIAKHDSIYFYDKIYLNQSSSGGDIFYNVWSGFFLSQKYYNWPITVLILTFPKEVFSTHYLIQP